MIWNNIHDLAAFISAEQRHNDNTFVCVSGGFDPLHRGHGRNIRSSFWLADALVAIVNGDGFLQRKKGFVFMSLEERMEIIDSLRCVDHVVAWDDGSQNVAGALKILRCNSFAKGGDRASPADMAPEELWACEEVGTKIVYGVGGFEKIQSSSWLLSKAPTYLIQGT